jgi:type III secretion protein L
MTFIIKAEEALSVRSFLSDRPVLEEIQVEPNPYESECARLEDELAKLNAAMDALRDENERAIAEAREEGRQQGIVEAADEEALRSATLAKGAEEALSQWQERLDGLERLAAQIARTALAKVFDDDDRRTELVVASIAHQLREIDQAAVIALRVSAADFPAGEALAALSEASKAAQFISCADLEPGECLIDLRLGHIDISPAAQWRELETLLIELARPDGAA